MKRVAIIAPDFSPSSLPPALRVRYFATHLREFGWEPIVITVDPIHYEYDTDTENMQLLPANLQVIRTQAVAARWTRRIGFGDIGIRSLWYAWRSLVKLHRSQPIDVLLLPVPPFVPMILGRLAYIRLGIPYVIDYIDPWRTDYFQRVSVEERPAKWRLAEIMANTLEPFAVRRASHLVAVSHGTNDKVISNYPWFNREATTEIPYGGEKRDFEFIRNHPRTNPIFDCRDRLLHVTSIGHFNPDLKSTAEALFRALAEGRRVEPARFGRLRLHFIGTTYVANAEAAFQVLPLARKYGLEDVVTERPQRLSYLDSLQIMMDSHALLVLGNPSPHYTASKVFPYVLARRPILALMHEQSSVAKILHETRAGTSITFTSERPLASQVDSIRSELSLLIDQPSHYEPPTDWEAFEGYTARSMTQRLATALDKTCVDRIGFAQ